MSARVPDNSRALVPYAGTIAVAEYVSFGSVASLLWRKRRVMALCIAAGAALGLLLAYSQKPVYRAQSSLEIEMPNEDYLGRRQLSPVLGPAVMLLEPFLQTQVKLLQSDTLVERVLDRLKLKQHPDFNRPPGTVARLKAKLRGKTMGPPDRRAIVAEARRRLTVRTAGQTQIVEILFESEDPKMAADFANGLAEEYQAQALSTMVRASTQTGELLKDELNNLQTAAIEAERKLETFVDANGLSLSGERESVSEARLRQTQSALGVAHEARVAEQARYESVRNTPADELARALDSETLRAYRVQLSELRRKRAEALEVLKPEHYKVRQLDAEILAVETSKERERKGIVERLRSLYEAAWSREQSLQRDYDQQSRAVSADMNKAVEYQVLKRDFETRRQLYETMLQKTKEAGLASAMKASFARVVDPAAPPEDPVKPNKPFYGVLGLAAGLFCGVVLAFASAAPTPKAHPAHVPAPEIPHLGSVPRLPGGPGVSFHAEPHAFRRIASFLLDRSVPPRIIAVTSVAAGDGRTTTACNLAIAAAHSGRSVLLIDGDHLNPQLHEVFQLGGDAEVVDLVLPQQKDTRTFPADSVWMTPVTGLYVLPGGAGLGPLHPPLDDVRTPAALSALCRDFDVIVVDTPPLLADPEARGWARCSDATLLVVAAGRTTPESLDRAVRLCAEEGLPLIGKIVNHHDNSFKAIAS